jgi:hypothetical protein
MSSSKKSSHDVYSEFNNNLLKFQKEKEGGSMLSDY